MAILVEEFWKNGRYKEGIQTGKALSGQYTFSGRAVFLKLNYLNWHSYYILKSRKIFLIELGFFIFF